MRGNLHARAKRCLRLARTSGFVPKHGEQSKKQNSFRCSVFLVTRAGIEPTIPPWKGDVLTSWPTGLMYINAIQRCFYLVATGGFEPPTCRVWTGRYRPTKLRRHSNGSRRRCRTPWIILVAGAGFEPRDLRVMSPTSYLAAPPRDNCLIKRLYYFIR